MPIAYREQNCHVLLPSAFFSALHICNKKQKFYQLQKWSGSLQSHLDLSDVIHGIISKLWSGDRIWCFEIEFQWMDNLSYSIARCSFPFFARVTWAVCTLFVFVLQMTQFFGPLFSFIECARTFNFGRLFLNCWWNRPRIFSIPFAMYIKFHPTLFNSFQKDQKTRFLDGSMAFGWVFFLAPSLYLSSIKYFVRFHFFTNIQLDGICVSCLMICPKMSRAHSNKQIGRLMY